MTDTMNVALDYDSVDELIKQKRFELRMLTDRLGVDYLDYNIAIEAVFPGWDTKADELLAKVLKGVTKTKALRMEIGVLLSNEQG